MDDSRNDGVRMCNPSRSLHSCSAGDETGEQMGELSRQRVINQPHRVDAESERANSKMEEGEALRKLEDLISSEGGDSTDEPAPPTVRKSKRQNKENDFSNMSAHDVNNENIALCSSIKRHDSEASDNSL